MTDIDRTFTNIAIIFLTIVFVWIAIRIAIDQRHIVVGLLLSVWYSHFLLIQFLEYCFMINITTLSILSIITQLIIYILTVLIMAIIGIIFICIWYIFEMDDKITKFVFSLLEMIEYEYLYKLNGRAPTYIYQQNYKNNNMFNCGICSNSLNYGKPLILKCCASIFHSKCLRKHELSQFDKFMNPSYASYECISCKNNYDWHQKWDYKYIDKNLFNHIRNDTLLKYVPHVIEDVIIQYV